MSIFDKARRAFLRTGHAAGLIRDIAMSRDGGTVISRGDDGVVYAWDVARRSARWAHTCADGRLAGKHGFHSSYILDDRHAVMGGDARVRIVRIADGTVACEHLVCGITIIAVTCGGGLLCGFGWRHRGKFAVIDPWTLAVRVRFADADAARELCYAGGTMAVLLSRSFRKEAPTAMTAWRVEGPAAGTVGWRQDDVTVEGWCVTGVDRVAVQESTSIREIDLSDGGEIARWSCPENAGDPMMLAGRLLYRMDQDDVELWVDAVDGTRCSELRHPQVEVDLWQRDHADQKPLDARPLAWGGHSWERPGPDSHAIAITASDDGVVAVVTADGSLMRWDFSRKRLIERQRVAPLPVAVPGSVLQRQALVARGDPEGLWMTWADGVGMVRRIDIATGRAVAEVATGIVGVGPFAVNGDSFIVASGWEFVGRIGRESGEHWLRCHSFADGSCRWRRPFPEVVTVVPAEAGCFAMLCAGAVQVIAAADGADAGEPMAPSLRDERGYVRGTRSRFGPVALRDGRVVANGWDGTLMWDRQDPAAAYHPNGVNESAATLAIMPGGRTVLVADHYCDYIAVIDAAERKRLPSLIGHLGPITAMALTPDGSRLVSAGIDGQVIVWDTATWTRVAQAALLPTDHGAKQGWWMIDGDGTMTGSDGYEAWLNPCRFA